MGTAAYPRLMPNRDIRHGAHHEIDPNDVQDRVPIPERGQETRLIRDPRLANIDRHS